MTKDLVISQGNNQVKRQAICETCLQVKQLYGSTETVAPWLCSCNQKSAQSSLPVAKPDAQQRITLTGTPRDQLANWRNRKP